MPVGGRQNCLLDNNIETAPWFPRPQMKCFTSVMAEGKVACHHSPGWGSIQFHVCHWVQEAGCHFASWADNLHVNMMGNAAVGGRRGNPAVHLACWSARIAFLKQWEPMELQCHWKSEIFFLINQWNNVQHRYGVCELESHHWSAFHFHLELLSEKQLLFQCSQAYSCFPVTLSWLILESEYGLRENSPVFCTEKRQVINWANSATYVRNFPWKNQSSS